MARKSLKLTERDERDIQRGMDGDWRGINNQRGNELDRLVKGNTERAVSVARYAALRNDGRSAIPFSRNGRVFRTTSTMDRIRANAAAQAARELDDFANRTGTNRLSGVASMQSSAKSLADNARQIAGINQKWRDIVSHRGSRKAMGGAGG